MTRDNKKLKAHIATAALLQAAIITSPGQAETYTVSPRQVDTIQILLDHVMTDGDVLQLEAGTYAPSQTIVFQNISIEVQGTADPNTGEPLSILDGNESLRLLRFVDAQVGLRSIQLKSGYGRNSYGGGAYLVRSSTSWEGCKFQNNTSAVGGAISLNDAAGDFTDCEFIGNAAESYGGAVHANNGHRSTYTRCQFKQNSSRDGGALVCWVSSGAEIRDSIFEENSATGTGGAFFETSGGSNIENTTFRSNTATHGGAMYSYNYGGTVSNCTFENNSAEAYGGAVQQILASKTFKGCTFSENSSGSVGGGLSTNYAGTRLVGCHFENNSANFGGGIATRDSYGNQLEVAIESTTIENNLAHIAGGGLYADSGTSPSIMGSEICSNLNENISGSWEDLGGNTVCSGDYCPTDINKDGTTDSSDLGVLLVLMGTSSPSGDFNSDGEVSAGDLGLLLGAWGLCS